MLQPTGWRSPQGPRSHLVTRGAAGAGSGGRVGGGDGLVVGGTVVEGGAVVVGAVVVALVDDVVSPTAADRSDRLSVVGAALSSPLSRATVAPPIISTRTSALAATSSRAGRRRADSPASGSAPAGVPCSACSLSTSFTSSGLAVSAPGSPASVMRPAR